MKEGYKVTYDREERNLREPEKSARGSADLSYSIFRWLIFNLHRVIRIYRPRETGIDSKENEIFGFIN